MGRHSLLRRGPTDSLVDGGFDLLGDVYGDGTLFTGPVTEPPGGSLGSVVIEEQHGLLFAPEALLNGKLAEDFVSGGAHDDDAG